MRSYLISAGAFITVCAFAVFGVSYSVAPHVAHASTTWYANSSTGNDITGNGTSGSPFKTFTKAYASSTAGDTINLTGTFSWANASETGATTISGFTIGKNLTIIGQGANQTFIEAANADNTAGERVFTISSGVTVTIEYVAVRYGRETLNTDSGGIENNGTTTLLYDEIYNNRNTGSSVTGGITNNATMTISNSSVHDNYATFYAAGLTDGSTATSLTITNSAFYNNIENGTGGANYGGALYLLHGPVYITNTTITGNSDASGGSGGGGVFNSGATTYVLNDIIANNSSGYSSGNDIYNVSGSVIGEGYNIIGQYYGGYTPTTGDWTNVSQNGIFVQQTTNATGTLNIDSTGGLNDSPYGVPSIGIEAGSIAINNGTTTSTTTNTVPSLDMRGAGRNGATDIGSFEYQGTGLTITAPTTQDSAIATSSVLYNQMTLSWTAGNGSRRTVFMSQSSSGTTTPVNGTSYTASSVFGAGTQIGSTGWYAVYDGIGNSVTVTGLASSTNYNIEVFEYNGINPGQSQYNTSTSTNNPIVQATYSPVTWYVNPATGSDSNTGLSSSSPFKTFTKAYASSSPADTINITGTLSLSSASETGSAVTTGFTISKFLTIQGNGSDQSIIQASTTSGSANRRIFTLSASTTLNINNIALRYGDEGTNGGCIYTNAGSILTINYSEIYGCRATGGVAGGIYAQSTTTILNSSIYNNIGYYSGGLDVYSGSSTVTVTNTSIFGNTSTGASSANGDGIDIEGGTVVVTNSTITANSGAQNGGGIYVNNTASAILYIENSIVAGNTATNGAAYGNIYKGASGVMISNGYNIFGDSTSLASSTGDWTNQSNNQIFALNGSSATGTINFDPYGYSYNDSPYKTDTYALEAGSIAINDGTSTATNDGVSVPTTDQRGAGRNGATDIGAYEYQGTGITIVTPTIAPSGVTASTSLRYTTISWTPGNASHYIIFLAQTNATSTVSPTNGSSYNPSSVFGSGDQFGSSGFYTVFNGNGTSSVTVTNLATSTSYVADVIGYNGTAGASQYLVSSSTSDPVLFTTYTPVTWYINTSTGSDTAATGSFSSPYKSFTKAYSVAQDGDTINITGTVDLTASETGAAATTGFTISKWITITGQSPASTTIQAASTDNTAGERIFTIAASTTVTIKNLTLRYGKSSNGYAGGCIEENSGDVVTLAYVDVFSCRSISAGGGAIDIPSIATDTIQNASFRNNISQSYGGAIQSIGASSTLFITNATFSGNQVPTGVGYYGGAFYIAQSKAWITNVTVIGNTSSYGAIGAGSTGTIYLKNVITEGNTATTQGVADLATQGVAGTLVSEGNNIVQRYSTSTSVFATTTGDWTDPAGSGIFTKFGTPVATGTISIAASTSPDATYGLYTYALQTGSIAINNGSSTGYTAGGATITIPTIDEIGTVRDASPDIGAYEFANSGVPPVISSVASSTGTTTATITWTTNDNASSTVNFGTTTAYGLSSTSASYVTSHSIVLTGLATSTTYHFQVASADSFGNLATSSDYTFLTTTPPDTTPPVVSITAPASSATVSGTSVTLSASSSDNVAVAGVTFYVDGAKQGSEATSSNSVFSIIWDSTATSSGTHTVFAVARDTSNNFATSSSVSFVVLNTGATPTIVAASSTRNGAVITWNTAAAASSQIFFGPTTSYSSSTPVFDASPRVTSHSVTLSGLPSCVYYHYEVTGQTAVSDSATSSDETFETLGCTGNALITANAAGYIATSAGGTLSQGAVTLTVPTGFTSTSTGATFQANQLDSAAFFAGAGSPPGVSAANVSVFDLKALTDASTTLPTFATPLSVSLSYTEPEISGLVESSLQIYRYDGTTWTALSNCSVDTVNHIVTCQTSNFSDFALFGQKAPAGGTGGSGGSSGGSVIAGGGGGSVQSEYSVLLAMGATAQANQLKAQYPWLFASGTAATTSSAMKTSPVFSGFTRYLQEGMQGNDVLQLQHFLNSHGFVVAATGPGSQGNETDMFGALTKIALEKFQAANAATVLTPAGLKKATGFFGAYTIKAVNALLK